MDNPLRVLFVTPEAVPFAKTGGLADVAGALPKSLRALGCEIKVIMPYYRMVKDSGLPHQYLGEEIEVPIGYERLKADIYEGRLNQDIPVYLIGREEFFDRPHLYGTPKGRSQPLSAPGVLP
jgi:starch synthase